MGDGWCGSCASGLLSCVSCCSSIEFVVAVVGASIYHVDVHIHFLVVGWVGGVGGDKMTPIAMGDRLELLADAPPHPAAVLVRVG